ncbi:CPBP family intramembrane glutamic endopeptidase [Maribacter antarcticus]|uniref:CPBP family intramembrane glutamic endopeptidase n=1 Tax=Maribacter antarcticus TaxID=505250 RepID=UPI00047C7C6E|nr:CPBP family intramembrane glutamic endopeptidase [Maribacter antarcticus]
MKIAIKNPFVITAITLLLFLGILKLPLDTLIDNFDLSSQQSSNSNKLVKNLVILILALFVIKKLKIVELSGLSQQMKLQNKFLILIPFYLVIIGVFSLLGTDLSSISTIDFILLSLTMLSVGFVEEFIFRGILQSVFLKKYAHRKNGILIGIFLPAALFGALHLLNLKMSNIPASIGQVVYAFFIGVAFGAILLKTNKVIPLAIIHGLINTVFSINTLLNDSAVAGEIEQQDIGQAIGSMLVVLPLFIVGLCIIRKINIGSIQEKIVLSSKIKHL